jgi:cytochrome c oxidase subunit II
MNAPTGGKRRLLAVLGLLALFAVACESNAPQDFLNNQASNTAKDADQLWDITFWIAVAVFVLVEGVLVFTILKFRQRPGREAAQFHGNTKLEVVLTIIPSLILAGIAVPTIATIFEAAEEPDNALTITVTGRQFWWEYKYDDLEVTTANEMHLPVGQPVHLRILGLEGDVNHSFWIPRLTGSQDVVPTHENELFFTPLETGTYLGQCKEFCGLSHANMRLRVFVQTEAEFQSWVDEQKQDAVSPTDSLAAQGEEIFMQQACAGCHTIQGTDALGVQGPNLTHLAGRTTFAGAMFARTDENLHDWVSDAPSMKPGVLMPSGTKDLGLTPEDVNAIVAYLQSLE